MSESGTSEYDEVHRSASQLVECQWCGAIGHTANSCAVPAPQACECYKCSFKGASKGGWIPKGKGKGNGKDKGMGGNRRHRRIAVHMTTINCTAPGRQAGEVRGSGW